MKNVTLSKARRKHISIMNKKEKISTYTEKKEKIVPEYALFSVRKPSAK
jgi:hypothetical protein